MQTTVDGVRKHHSYIDKVIKVLVKKTLVKTLQDSLSSAKWPCAGVNPDLESQVQISWLFFTSLVKQRLADRLYQWRILITGQPHHDEKTISFFLLHSPFYM